VRSGLPIGRIRCGHQRPRGDRVVAGAVGIQPAADEHHLVDVELGAHERSERWWEVGAGLQSGEGEVAGEALPRRLPEVSGPLGDRCGEVVDALHRHHECALAEQVDARPDQRNGRVEMDAGERVGDLVRIRVAEESERDVPPLGRDEPNAALVLASELHQLVDDVLGWDHGDEQTWHAPSQPSRSVRTMTMAHGPLDSSTPPQRVIITAAAAGIGRSIAAVFHADGAVVHLCDVDDRSLDQVRAELPGVRAARVDLLDGEAIDAWIAAAIDELEPLGGVDVLVNNAGTKGPTAYVEDVHPAEWRDCLAVTLDSHYRTARLVAPVMKRHGRGSIVNISSTAGQVGYGMRTPYAAAKWAVIGLTKSLAIELGPHGVRCNAICPGSVRGDRIDRVILAEAASRGVPPEVIAHEYVAGQSIGRFVEPSEIAAMCRFLASPAAAMVTGQAIAIDGHSETYHL